METTEPGSQETRMNPLLKFTIRCVAAFAAAMFLNRFFLDSRSWYAIVGLTVLLVVMSYVLEASRRDRD